MKRAKRRRSRSLAETSLSLFLTGSLIMIIQDFYRYYTDPIFLNWWLSQPIPWELFMAVWLGLTFLITILSIRHIRS